MGDPEFRLWLISLRAPYTTVGFPAIAGPKYSPQYTNVLFAGTLNVGSLFLDFTIYPAHMVVGVEAGHVKGLGMKLVV